MPVVDFQRNEDQMCALKRTLLCYAVNYFEHGRVICLGKREKYSDRLCRCTSEPLVFSHTQIVSPRGRQLVSVSPLDEEVYRDCV